MTVKGRDAAPDSVRQVVARGWPAAMPPLHPQPVLWSSSCEVAGADLIPQRDTPGSGTEKLILPKNI